MTIRQLAERTGMTVRNIRAHQTRGLLPPPVVRGRTGYYNEEHVARIELTREMQADGLNLEAIRRVFETSDGSAVAEIFDFTRALRMPFEDESAGDLRAGRARRAPGARGGRPRADPPRRKAGHAARPARRPDRGDQPAPAAGRGRAGRARRRPRGGDRDRREAAPPRRRRRPHLRRHLRRGDLGALRPRRPARAGMAADPRGARTDAAAGRPGPARRLPDRDGRGRPRRRASARCALAAGKPAPKKRKKPAKRRGR